MCQFFSAIISRNGECYSTPDARGGHQNIESYFKLREGSRYLPSNLAKIEFIPSLVDVDYNVYQTNKTFESENLNSATKKTFSLRHVAHHKLESYSLMLDDPDLPEWFKESHELQAKAEDYCRSRLRRMIITEDTDILRGGAYIIGPNTCVTRAVGCYIISMAPESRIIEAEHCEIGLMHPYSRIKYLGEGCVVRTCKGHISIVERNACVIDLLRDAYIYSMKDYGHVVRAEDNSRIENLHDNTSIKYLYPLATVGMAKDFSTIYCMGLPSCSKTSFDGPVVIDKLLDYARIIFPNCPDTKMHKELVLMHVRRDFTLPNTPGGVFAPTNELSNTGIISNVMRRISTEKPNSPVVTSEAQPMTTEEATAEAERASLEAESAEAARRKSSEDTKYK